jgi:FkbM family methyltransferase
MKRFYNHFISPGDLCFDIGANQGEYARIFLELGAGRVVAVEPVKKVFDELVKVSSSDRFVPLMVGISSMPGTREMHVNEPSDLSSFSDEYNSLYKQQGVLKESRTEKVTCMTLDQLIDQYGVPSYCKIDTEGHETEVLSGLTKGIPVLSFEFLYPFKERTLACIDRVKGISPAPLFNYSLFEFFQWENPRWMNASEFSSCIRNLPEEQWTGEIFCRLK